MELSETPMKFKLNCIENDIDKDPSFIQKAEIRGCNTKVRDLADCDLDSYVVRATVAGIKPKA